MHKTRAHKTARATAKAYAADQRVLARSPSTRKITLPRVVDTACRSREFHYLVYLTEAEIAFVLQHMAAKPTGAIGPQGTLCGPPELEGEQRAEARAPAPPPPEARAPPPSAYRELLDVIIGSRETATPLDYYDILEDVPLDGLTEAEMKELEDYAAWYDERYKKAVGVATNAEAALALEFDSSTDSDASGEYEYDSPF